MWGWHVHILIVEDQNTFRHALAELLLELSQVSVVLEANSVKSARDLILEQHDTLNLVILDHGLPDGYGIDLLIEMKGRHPDLCIAILSAYHDINLMKQAMNSGAHGFIPKTTATPVLLSALKLILAGGIYIYPDLYDTKPSFKMAMRQNEFRLTIRQNEVLNLICSGLSNKAIAYQLDITEATVKAHVTAILKHYGVSSRTQLLLPLKH